MTAYRLVALLLALGACGGAETPTPPPAQPMAAPVAACPEQENCCDEAAQQKQLLEMAMRHYRGEPDDIYASLLIMKDEVWVGLNTGDRRQIRDEEDGSRDYESVTESVSEYLEMPIFEKRTDIQIAATPDVPVAEILRIAKIVKEAGFTTPELMEPKGLASRFVE